MQAHTQPPYRLTLKSNGCLILIAALSPSHLVVASKHSLGTTTEFQGAERSDTADTLVTERLHKLAIQDSGQIGAMKKGKGQANGHADEEDEGERMAEAHAQVGRRWVKRTLEAKGRTEAELARRLWDANSAAVLEVRAIPVYAISLNGSSALR